MAEPATELNSLKRVSIVQQVEQVIADRIMDGTYAVDTKLPAEMTLSKQLGVGRGTVREAFRLLEAKGLVEIRPGRGAFVASDKEAGTEQTVQWFRANEMELLDCVQVRNALEPAGCPPDGRAQPARGSVGTATHSSKICRSSGKTGCCHHCKV